MDGAIGGSDAKSFCSKPARGWSHADSIISNEGVTFNVRVSSIKISSNFFLNGKSSSKKKKSEEFLLALFGRSDSNE